MTRSEAAKICQSIKFMMDKDDYSEAVEEALDRAIEALEQEETLKNLTKPNKSDLISRQAAIDAVHSYFKDKLDGLPTEETEEGYEVVCDMDKIDAFLSDNKYLSKRIENLPTAQPDYQEVLGWLLAYHTMSFDLHCRYLPHDVISWLINDFTKKFIAKRRQNERLG